MSSQPRSRRLTLRALAGALASVAALLIWVVAVPILDIRLNFTDPAGAEQTIGPGALIFFSFGPALAGWAFIAILEWLASRWAKLIWTIAAVALLLLSMLPLFSVSVSAAVTLAIMHLAVGAVIIWIMRSTSPTAAPAPAAG
jgi:hypothetical protein